MKFLMTYESIPDAPPPTPEQMAAGLPELLDAGASVVGGCCGSTPGHIRRLREGLDAAGRGRA